MSADLPDGAYLAALAGFERMSVGRLRALLRHHRPVDAYHVASGVAAPAPDLTAVFARADGLAEAWREAGRRRTPERCWAACVDHDIDVLTPGDPRFPPQLLDDPACPAVLFVQGDTSVLDARRVGVIGTRNCTRRGSDTAHLFGRELSDEGVVVLSGLARGIDGAAHRGALASPAGRPVGIVGNGLDRPYPKQHTDLWHEVAERGLLVSEWPPGTPPDAFRFPLRNRILAAMVEVLVVVESRERGGSLITAKEAAERSVEVMAVPGSVHSRASSGTNRLLADGAMTANETADVLMALGLDHRRAGRARFDPRPLPRGVAACVLEACRAEARTLDDLVAVVGGSIADAALVAARLERDGWLDECGGWYQAVAIWSDR